MQISILSGIYTDKTGNYRVEYPVNMVPVPVGNGISQGYLRPADGITEFATGPGIDRGGINWNGVCYRVMGSKLVSVSASGVVATLGDVGNDGKPAIFDYSFDRLAIASNLDLFYWDGVALTQVTDADLGDVYGLAWVDGYFMTTDGEFLVVTELNDPTSVNPLKYGSSEADPDPVKALVKLRNEIYAVNRHTIEVFNNVGGSGFPFQRVEGAQIQKGAVGNRAACVFMDSIAFVGSARNESLGVYLAVNGGAAKISTREIDTILESYPDDVLAELFLEARADKSQKMLMIHLPDRCLVYDIAASEAFKQQVWHILTSATGGFSRYLARGIVRCYDKWIVGHPSAAKVGVLTDENSYHWGNPVRWELSTAIIYNSGQGAIVYQLELVANTGRTALGKDPAISTSYSTDGETWSMPKTIKAGKTGERMKRLVWFQQGMMTNWRIQRFRGTSDGHLAITRLEAQMEGLYR